MIEGGSHLGGVDLLTVHDLVKFLVADVEDVARHRLELAACKLNVVLIAARRLLLQTLLRHKLSRLLRRVDERVGQNLVR